MNKFIERVRPIRVRAMCDICGQELRHTNSSYISATGMHVVHSCANEHMEILNEYYPKIEYVKEDE